MPLDHSAATITILLDGLALFCLDPPSPCEIGFVKDANHNLTVDVLSIREDGIMPLEHQLDLSRDIQIFVIDGVTLGTSKFEPGQGFTRDPQNSDTEDFRWIVDLEGYPFHEAKLQIVRRPRPARDEINPILRIAAGIFYTLRLSPHVFRLVDWSVDPPETVVDHIQIGDVVGVDIHLHDDRGRLVLQNHDDEDTALVLPKMPGTRYAIMFNNVCTTGSSDGDGEFDSPLVGQGTDFRRYYKFVTDERTGRKFDFDKQSKGRFPQNCDLAYLGRTSTLG